MSAEGRHTALIRVSTKRSRRRARLLRPQASLLSSQLHLAGVGATTSRLFRPREPDLRNRWRLFFCPGDLRGQPGFHDMPPTVPTNSRNQCAPVWEAVKLPVSAWSATVNFRNARHAPARGNKVALCASSSFLSSSSVLFSGWQRAGPLRNPPPASTKATRHPSNFTNRTPAVPSAATRPAGCVSRKRPNTPSAPSSPWPGSRAPGRSKS